MSENNVIEFNGITKLDIPADRVLENAKGKLKHVVILGWDEDDNELFACTMADGGDLLWLLERAKFRLMETAKEED